MTTESTPALRPSEKRALDLWDSLPEGERTYKAVAGLYTKDDGSHITEGRAAGYLREALTKSGRTDELPRRSNGERSTATPVPAPTGVEDMVTTMITKLRTSIEQAEGRATEAEEQAEQFDADKFKAEEQERRQEEVRKAQARLKAWKDDADSEASNAAEAAQKALTDRATKVREETDAATEKMRAELDKYEKVASAMADLLETAE